MCELTCITLCRIDGATRKITGISASQNASCLFTDLGPGQETTMVYPQSLISCAPESNSKRSFSPIAPHFYG